jgi:pimeloyl-ACP methyl ester carboxylesterase
MFNEMIARDVMGHAWSTMEIQDKAEVKEIISHYIEAATKPTWLGLAKALRITDDFIDEARAIKAPVLYLYGNKTSFSKMIETNIEYFKKNLPNILLYSFEDGIHDLELQKPKETASLIVDFLVSEGAKNLAMQTTKLEIQESWKGLPGMSRHEYHESVFQ